MVLQWRLERGNKKKEDFVEESFGAAGTASGIRNARHEMRTLKGTSCLRYLVFDHPGWFFLSFTLPYELTRTYLTCTLELRGEPFRA